MKRLLVSNSPRGLLYFSALNFSVLNLIVICAMFVIVLIPQKPAQAEISDKNIIGGQEVEANVYPWMVGLIENDKKDVFWAQYCGGTLIHPEWVLTAAHCTYEFGRQMTADEIDILAGQHELRASNGERIAVELIIRHPAYDDATGDSDLALIKLATPSEQPIVTIADSSMVNIDETGAQGFALGWGRTDTNMRVNHLHQVNVPLVTAEICTSAYTSIGYVMTDNMLCAGYQAGGKDACAGDSGGPLVIREDEEDKTSEWIQVGVISWGKGCAQADAYGVYTHVAHFQGWVNVVIAANTVATDSGTTTVPPTGQESIARQVVFMPIVDK